MGALSQAGVGEPASKTFPRAFGPFVLLRRIGGGGMGDVFLATRGSLATGVDVTCVVKTLRDEHLLDPEYVTRFIDEARVLVQLNHKNICQVHEVGKLANTYFLAMEQVDGRDLKEVVDRGALPEDVAIAVAIEILDALDYAHRLRDATTGEPLRVVHRDVSPKNVMVSAAGEVKLIDFGLAESKMKQAMTEPNIVIGKIAYMSPERARRDPVDARADLFAVGVLLYELVTGERYYGTLTLDDIWRRAGLGTWRAPRLDQLEPKLRFVIERAVAGDVAQRTPTCAVFRDELRALQSSRSTAAGPKELRALMAARFPDDDADRNAALAELRRIAEIVDDTFLDPLQPTDTQVIAARTSSSLAPEPAVTDVYDRAPISTAVFDNPAPTHLIDRVPPPRSRTPLLVAALGVLAAGAAALFVLPRLDAVITARPPAVAATALTPVADAAPSTATPTTTTTAPTTTVPAPSTTTTAPTTAPTTTVPAPATTTTAPTAPAPATTTTAPTTTAPTTIAPTATTTPATNAVAKSTAPSPTAPTTTAPRVSHVEAPRKKALPAPPPVDERFERREYLKRHCAAMKCTPKVLAVDLNKLDPPGMAVFVHELNACVDACVR